MRSKTLLGSSLLGSLAFAAIAALGSIPWTMMAAPFIGRLWAVAIYCLATVVFYAVTIAPTWSRGLAGGGFAAALAVVVGLLASWPSEAILGAALTLAMVRSGILYRGRPLRTLLLETALILGGLLAARFLVGPTPLATGLAIWSFFLAQSLFFLMGGITAREPEEVTIDPFEHAKKQVLGLMEES